METTPAPAARPARRERLLKRWHLLVLALVPLGALILVAQNTRTTEKSVVRPDGLSLQYLRLQVSTRPQDTALQLHLVRTLLATGNLEEASQRLAAIKTDDAQLRAWAVRLGLQIHVAQYTQDPKRVTREPALLAQLIKEIETLMAEPLSADELARLADTSLLIGHPELAARIYLRLAEIDAPQRDRWRAAAAQQENASGQPAVAAMLYDQLVSDERDPEKRRAYARLALSAMRGADQPDKAVALANRYVGLFPDDVQLLELAAQVALSSGQPATAGRHYDRLFDLARSDAEKKRFAKLALSALTAADHPDAALAAAGRYLDRFPEEPDLLGMGVKLALANRELRLAKTWGRTRLRLDPRSEVVLEQLNTELAAGDAVAALELARRLVRKRPGSTKLRERVAQIAEWSGKPDVALESLAYLAEHTSNPRFLARALKLAPQLWEQETLAALLSVKARQGRLSSAELLSLVTTFEAIAEPERLVQILESYLSRHADHKEAWEALAEVHERRGDLPHALSTFEHVSRSFGSNLKELTHRAELLWKLEKPTAGYVLLRDVLDHVGVAQTHDLLAHAALGTMGERALPPERRAGADGATTSVATAPAGDPKSPSAGGAAPGAAASDDSAKKEDGAQKDAQAFLTLLGQLFFFSEPRPDSLDDYRKLWRAGALVRESAARYLQLTKLAGLTDESLAVAEESFRRFEDPEMLLAGMDLAFQAARWTDLTRLVDVAKRNEEVFAENKYYHLILAEYYTHQGAYERAQRAYLRVLTIDPSLAAARANLLWLLLDHSDEIANNAGKRSRHALFRYLTAWNGLAQEEPSLWLPFATGWAMLGRSRDALSFYKREWTRRPTDHLWLLGYVATLDAVSRSSDARRLRRFALTALQEEAERAAHRGATRGEREVLKAYAELVRDVYGPGKGSRWMTRVLRSDLEPEVQRGLAATWRSDGSGFDDSRWVMDSSTVTRKNPWGRFAKAAKPSQDQVQATLADASALPSEEVEPAPAPLRVLAPDAGSGEDQVPRNAHIVTLEAGAQIVNDLVILATSVTAKIARGAVAFGGHLGVNRLLLDDTTDPQAGATEVEVEGFAQWRHRLGRLEVGIGANLRSDANLLTGWASETFNVWRGGTLTVAGHFNELAYDTRWLRVYGARHRGTLGLTTSFLTDGFLSVQGNVYRYQTRTNEALGTGANAEIDLGYRIRRVRPLWTVRVSGSYTRNFNLADILPEFGSSSSSAVTILDALPPVFAAVGAGTHIEHRFPGASAIGAGRFRYMGDVWVGWMWPLNIPAFEIRGGVSMGLPHRQEIGLRAFIANNRWLGPGVINAGVSLNFVFR